MNAVASVPERIVCADGMVLHGHWFVDHDADSRATVIVATGAAAAARFYRGFCEYLATQGFRVLCFDFRTVGASRHGPIHGDRDSGFSTWIEQDYPAVIMQARSHRPDLPLLVVGHSAGGWMSGIHAAVDKVHGILGVAALNGFWRHMARPHRYAHWLAWHVLVPVATRVLGFWPGLIGFNANMPPRFGQEFSRWGRHKDFVFSDPMLDARGNASRFRGAMHLLQISDDPWGTMPAVADYARRFPNASVSDIEVVDPGQCSATSLGHFGFFRREHRDTLWPLAAQRLSAMIDENARTSP